MRRLAGAALTGLAACTQPRTGPVPESAATPRVQSHLLVSGEWLAGRAADPAVVVLHVAGDRGEYDRGHIPGARFLPLGAIVRTAAGLPNELPTLQVLDSVFESVGVGDGVQVVVYGPPLAAARAFFTLDYLGHGERTALLDGGLAAWRAAGRPVSNETPRIEAATFSPAPRRDRVVDAAWVSGRLRDSTVALIDARPDAQFTGAEPGDGISRPGHIPGAGSLFWERTIESTASPALRDTAALRVLLRQAGAGDGDTVVAYCRTGMQASFAYFVARYLGYRTRMYDGSFIEWSRRPELPVER